MFARMEMEQKSARQKRAYIQLAEAGAWQATYRPFGYTTDGQPLEPEATAVRNAYAAVLNNESLRKIAKRWNEAGYCTPAHGRAHRPAVDQQAGAPLPAQAEVQGRGGAHPPPSWWKGRRVEVTKTYNGTWTALVDEVTWEGVAATLRDPSRDEVHHVRDRPPRLRGLPVRAVRRRPQ